MKEVQIRITWYLMRCYASINEDEKLFNLTLVYKILIDFQFIIKLEETSQAFNGINSTIWNVI